MTDLAWRVEAACRDAHPAGRSTALGGWMLRQSNVFSKRTNSLNPIGPAAGDPRPSLGRAFALAGAGLIVRVPSLCEGADAALDDAGFGRPEAETLTLHAPSIVAVPSNAATTKHASRDWLAARARLDGEDAAASAAFRLMTDRIAVPVRYAEARLDGRIAAIGYAAIADGLLVLEAVATDPEHRRRGLARQVVARLIAWAKQEGVGEACLQVVADNAPAIALYRQLGFTDELYRYHYRRRTLP